MKRMSRFLPSERCTVEQADFHYEAVHHRFAMRMFREHAPTVRLYAINHAIAQLDLAGTFLQRPAAWRFVILDLAEPEEGSQLGGKEWLPSWAEQAIITDHTNFLREVRPFEVEPRSVVDRRTEQTSLAKYLIEVDAVDEGGRAAARETYDRIWDAIGVAGEDAFGLRLAVENRALREAEMAPVLEPGQAYTGRYRPDTAFQGFGELYFDHRVWAEEFFRRPEIAAAVSARAGVHVGVYAINELVGVDRR